MSPEETPTLTETFNEAAGFHSHGGHESEGDHAQNITPDQPIDSPQQLPLPQQAEQEEPDIPSEQTPVSQQVGQVHSELTPEYDRDEWRKMLEAQREEHNAEMHHRPKDPELLSEVHNRVAQELEVEIAKHDPDNDPIIDDGFDLDF